MLKRILSAVVFAALVVPAAHAIDDYKLGPDSMEQPGVPKGDLIPFKWESKIFAGTVRDCWIYVPKQYDGKTPAAVMVFQDGNSYQNPKGSYRATIVMDNLIHKKQIPVMIGIFINPGVFPDKLDAKKKPASNRSFEYDSLTPQYVQFLEKEILPEVAKKYKLRQDAAGRGICGASSGGICAFTAAWERPDLFSKVLSHIGSFTNIRGGDRYPGIIRKEKNKPIRVFLQDGSNDLDNAAGNWYLGNLQMEAALKFKKYDYQTVWGDGKHTGIHGGSILPESMRWLWREEPKANSGTSQQTKLYLDRQTPYILGERIKVTVRFPDEAKVDVKTRVMVTVAHLPAQAKAEVEKSTISLAMVEGTKGTFEGIWDQTREGKYRFSLSNPDVSAVQTDKEKPTAEAIVVLPPDFKKEAKATEGERILQPPTPAVGSEIRARPRFRLLQGRLRLFR